MGILVLILAIILIFIYCFMAIKYINDVYMHVKNTYFTKGGLKGYVWYEHE